MTRRGFLSGAGLLAPLVGLLAACGGRSARPASPSAYRLRGLASWYGLGDGYDGRVTASGERFARDQLTAAHYNLPFDTQVRVRNLANGREVDLRINDRIPRETLDRGRILDVSYGGAQRLRMVDVGVVPVEITVRSWGPTA